MRAWLDRFFASYSAHHPVNATFIGVHEHDHRLPDFSESGAGDTVADMRDLLQRADAVDSAELDPFEAIDLRLTCGFLALRRWEYQSRHHQLGNPATYTGEAVFGVMSLFLSDFAPLGRRVAAAVERLHAVPAFLGQCRANVARCPGAWTERAERECRGALAFLGEGIDLLIAESGIEGGALRVAADRAAMAFGDLRHWLESELRQRPSDDWAAGEEALALHLREGHCVDETPDEICRYAEEALVEAERAADEHPTAASGPAPGPSLERYYARYQELWDHAREAAVARDLLTWPEFPIRYVPRPAWARAAAPDLYFLFYRSPAAFGRPPVHDYLVTPIELEMPPARRKELLAAHDDAVIKLNHVIHHGGVGHHVQNRHAFRARSRIGRVAAVDGASRIAMLCGGTMAEGWACYATDLMDEIGFLTPTEQRMERRSRRRMCARAVVDVRLHQGRLTLDQAADAYVRRAGMSPDTARAEAAKTSMFPGTALMYLMGTEAIHRLRRELAAREGPAFSLRAFHDRFLGYGSIPVSLIAAEMLRRPADPLATAG